MPPTGPEGWFPRLFSHTDATDDNETMVTPSPAASNPAADRPCVLFLNRTYPPARASSGRLLRELARAFARDGWNVRVITTHEKGGDIADGPVRLTRLAIRPGRLGVGAALGLLFRMLKAGLRGPRPHLVISLTDPPLLGIVGHLITRLRRARHIHWCHDVFPDLLPVVGVKIPKFAHNWLYRAVRRAMNRADRVVVIGRCMARHLTQNGVDARRVILIPNWPELAMNPQIFGTLPEGSDGDEGASIPTPTLLDGGPKFRVLYVGTVNEAHPIDTILDAATILESMNPEVEFIFIGDEGTQLRVTTERAKRGLGNIRVLPFQPQSRLRDIMESGDVHLISMRHEAAGMMVPAKFYAALSAARPCILVGPEATEMGRVIADYGAGAVVPQRAAQQLAQTITDFRMREDLWFKAHDGAMKAAAAYTAEEMIRLWLRKARDVIRAS